MFPKRMVWGNHACENAVKPCVLSSLQNETEMTKKQKYKKRLKRQMKCLSVAVVGCLLRMAKKQCICDWWRGLCGEIRGQRVWEREKWEADKNIANQSTLQMEILFVYAVVQSDQTSKLLLASQGLKQPCVLLRMPRNPDKTVTFRHHTKPRAPVTP